MLQPESAHGPSMPWFRSFYVKLGQGESLRSASQHAAPPPGPSGPTTMKLGGLSASRFVSRRVPAPRLSAGRSRKSLGRTIVSSRSIGAPYGLAVNAHHRTVYGIVMETNPKVRRYVYETTG